MTFIRVLLVDDSPASLDSAADSPLRHAHVRVVGTRLCYDGRGYPDSLAGDGIPRLAQITGIVDVFDALTTDRRYRAALSIGEACMELCAGADRGRRRRDLVEAFVELVGSDADSKGDLTIK